MTHERSLCGLRLRVDVLELRSSVLQVLANLFALGDELTGCTAPIREQLLEALAADALPISFEAADVALYLRLGLVLDLIVELDEGLSKLAHQVGVYMNCCHSMELLSSGCHW